jgi:hypothetical protein
MMFAVSIPVENVSACLASPIALSVKAHLSPKSSSLRKNQDMLFSATEYSSRRRMLCVCETGHSESRLKVATLLFASVARTTKTARGKRGKR